MQKPCSRPTRRDAFTLIELVTVMMILGILSGVAAPRYLDALSERRVDCAARRVAADLRFAQAEALRTSQPVEIVFAPGSDSYAMATVEDRDHPDRGYVVDLSAEPYGVDLASAFGANERVTFDAYGAPNRFGGVRLQHGSHRVAVTCDRLGSTGYGSW